MQKGCTLQSFISSGFSQPFHLPQAVCICSTWKRRRPPFYGRWESKKPTGVGAAGRHAPTGKAWLELELVEQGTVMKCKKGTWRQGCSCQEPPLQSSVGELMLQVQYIQGIHMGLVDMAQHVLKIRLLMDWQLADGSRPSVRNRHVDLGTWITPASQGWPHWSRHLSLNACIWETPLTSHPAQWSQSRQRILQQSKHLHMLHWTGLQAPPTVLTTSPPTNRSLRTQLIQRHLSSDILTYEQNPTLRDKFRCLHISI